MVRIYIILDNYRLTKILHHTSMHHLRSISIEILPPVQILSCNLKHIIVIFLHWIVSHPPWILTHVLLDKPKDMIYIIEVYLSWITKLLR